MNILVVNCSEKLTQTELFHLVYFTEFVYTMASLLAVLPPIEKLNYFCYYLRIELKFVTWFNNDFYLSNFN